MSNETEDRLEQEVAFANEIKQVTNNKSFQQAITARKAHIFDVFCRTKPDQQEVREEAYRTMVNMNAFEKYFETIATTGKMAQIELDKIND